MLLVFLLPVLLVYALAPKPSETTEQGTFQSHEVSQDHVDRYTSDIIDGENSENARNRRRHQASSSDHVPDTEDEDVEYIEENHPDEKHLDALNKDQLDNVKSDPLNDESIVHAENTVGSSTICPKCNAKDIEKETKIEMIKQHLLGKLGLTSAPEVKGPLHPLPFDFYMEKDFAQNDEEEREAETDRTITRQIFVFGEDSKWN